jgi:hypothetical protein
MITVLSKASLLRTRVTVVRVFVARVLVELALIDVVQLRASERVGEAVQLRAKEVLGGVDVCEQAGEDVGQLLNGQLHNVAHQIVRLRLESVTSPRVEFNESITYLKESRAVEHTAGKIGGVHACECVDLVIC